MARSLEVIDDCIAEAAGGQELQAEESAAGCCMCAVRLG